MALISCPECGKLFSEFADKCPNCGCPKEKAVQINATLPNQGKAIASSSVNNLLGNLSKSVNLKKYCITAGCLLLLIVLTWGVVNYTRGRFYSREYGVEFKYDAAEFTNTSKYARGANTILKLERHDPDQVMILISATKSTGSFDEETPSIADMYIKESGGYVIANHRYVTVNGEKAMCGTTITKKEDGEWYGSSTYYFNNKGYLITVFITTPNENFRNRKREFMNEADRLIQGFRLK